MEYLSADAVIAPVSVQQKGESIMGESPGRKQISINPRRSEYEEIVKAADLHGMKPGTLTSALWEWASPLFSANSYSVATLKEKYPSGLVAICNNYQNVNKSPTLSDLDAWALGFVKQLTKSGDIKDLLQLADRKRYPRPDEHVAETRPIKTRGIKTVTPGRRPRALAQ